MKKTVIYRIKRGLEIILDEMEHYFSKEPLKYILKEEYLYYGKFMLHDEETSNLLNTPNQRYLDDFIIMKIKSLSNIYKIHHS